MADIGNSDVHMKTSEFDLEQFKAEYEKCGKYELKPQIEHLAALADKYFEKYQRDGDKGEWTDCLKAHSLLNSAGARDPSNQKWYDKVHQVQKAYWKDSVNKTPNDHRDLDAGHIRQLHQIRDEMRGQLEQATGCANAFTEDIGLEEHSEEKHLKEEFVECVKNVSVSCTDQMLRLIEQIMDECVDMLEEKPPCSFSVVAIGSMARGEATPYSDLEYMFLLESGSKTKEAVIYFERLAVITYMIIGNFRETKLSYMAIEELKSWFDDTSKNGLKIDGLAEKAGNIPTGNGSLLTRNKFIATPEEIRNLYKSVFLDPVEDEALKGDLTAMLAYMKDIYVYTCPKKQQSPNILQKLKELLAAIKPNDKRKEVNRRMFMKDMEKYDFKPDANLCGRANFTIDVKTDLHRFPSILAYDLSIIYDCFGDSVWDTVVQLYERRHISLHIRESILFLLACACYVRLSTYLYHDSHDDRVSVLPVEPSLTPVQSSAASKRWPMPGGLLFRMCECLVPLKQAIKRNYVDIGLVLKCESLQPDWWCSLQTRFFCNRHISAFEFLKHQFSLDQICDPSMFEIIAENSGLVFTSDMRSMVGEILFNAGHQDHANKYLGTLDEKNVSQQLMGMKLKEIFLAPHNKGSGCSDFIPAFFSGHDVSRRDADDLVFDMFGMDREEFEQTLPYLAYTPQISILHSLIRGIFDTYSIAVRSYGMETYWRLYERVVEFGVRDVRAFGSYDEKLEAIVLCVMCNGDLYTDLMIKVNTRKVVSSASPITSKADFPTPSGESQLIKLMRLAPKERLAHVTSQSLATWIAMTAIGVDYAASQKFEIGNEYLDKAESLLSKRYGQGAVHLQMQIIKICKAINLRMEGRNDESIKLLDTVKDIIRFFISANDPASSSIHEIFSWIEDLNPKVNLIIQVASLSRESIKTIWDFGIKILCSTGTKTGE